ARTGAPEVALPPAITVVAWDATTLVHLLSEYTLNVIVPVAFAAFTPDRVATSRAGWPEGISSRAPEWPAPVSVVVRDVAGGGVVTVSASPAGPQALTEAAFLVSPV